MPSDNTQNSQLEDLVLDSDTGARRPEGVSLKVISTIAFTWSLFQLWIASPLPFFFAEHFPLLKYLVLDATKSRYIHLTFAFLLAYLAYPATSRSPKTYIPLTDWAIALVAAFSTLYLLFFYTDLSSRAGLPTQSDIVISIIGLALLLEATRRSLGLPLLIIASIFLSYTYFGQYMPDVIQHKGHNFSKIASHQWLSTEGVFGIALGVSSSFVFLFVLFGSMLDKAGAGNYFIRVAFALLGHMRGGPAKAAVLSSAMTGVISGSSIANVVTTGTFTVPLMRKVGFSAEKAGSIEVASSVNGQIMPPVMGAAAFLMVEYIGIPYIEVIRHAFIPAVISYIALLYIVHLEAIKSNMKVIPRRDTIERPAILRLLRTAIIISSIIILSGIVYYIFSFIKHFIPEHTLLASCLIVALAYIGLLKVASNYGPIAVEQEINELPELAPTVKSGLHYLLPIVVLIWCLMVERLSPGLSAFWATVFMIFISLTQDIVINFFKNQLDLKKDSKKAFAGFIDGMITGAKNMAAIGIATAAAGIIVGSVTQTGIGAKMTELVAIVAGDSIMIMLLLTAVICIILGMGLPTTANYIVVSSLMATVIVELGKKNGLIVPLVAVHFFVFYFGIMADVTPPVGLASFAAAAVSGGDPIKTSFQAFMYSTRTMILPFVFIFNNELLLIGVEGFWDSFLIFITASVAILIFSAGSQGYFIVKSKLSESFILILISLTLFVPSFWIDKISPPYKEYPVSEFEQLLDADHNEVRLKVAGEDFIGDPTRFVVDVKFPENLSAQDKLQDYGISLYKNDDRYFVDSVEFASQSEKDGIAFDFEITHLFLTQEQPGKMVVYIPALLLFAFIASFQYSRRKEETHV
ncbi:MAG: TRAP transporter permease [Rickettsiales bacterium]|mgnify:CR=1 FL=1|jgi:TRAP transporter 4TM/12TM fusion protein|nr:TRAP transporter permease [Rickettsiales bacterium]